jgi:hypothetical protein
MKRIKNKIAALVCGIALLVINTSTADAVEKHTELVYHYTYTTSCGTYHEINSKTQLTQSGLSSWHAVCEFFGGC